MTSVLARLRPSGTRPDTVMVPEPWLRRAENVLELDDGPVVVRLTILRCRAAAAGVVVILALAPCFPGAWCTRTVPESRSAFDET